MAEMMTVKRDCPLCGKKSEVEVDYRKYQDWKNGELVQNAFPELTADQREVLISGICSECWKNI